MIGILGGSFDPVHYGHLRPALEVQQFLGLDEIRLVPSLLPPHRPQPQASPQQRVAMLNAAVENYPVFKVDTREFDREGPSYTLDTLISLREEMPGVDLCLLVGMDAFQVLASWHRWRELTDHCHMVVLDRPGAQLPTQGELADFIRLHRVMEPEKLGKQSFGLLYFHAVSQLQISSTAIRKLLASGGDAGFLLPERVLDVVRSKSLYGVAENQ
ncbi:MAG: nicotinate-nucleotide adenylyltransferase [Gammaproteobacteria bacterium]|jgi:nicotinate-nucleotide adenylyltransferase|nr:nicotinate-nucleotide adenylyltransferase [Gammaproteobacteria bacterium]MDH3933881.1 nicotinate-nucleotide adenylyltransferase [Gammaproteobacteria bacterium]MDH3970798.1 nicotinate-nucleotide adenylyltransferase [Gammaproteobacteria bacterium]MDH3986006.1 nicotinate-nucleotide adenylyltransferase [Gammaproteobacteria bacterium]